MRTTRRSPVIVPDRQQGQHARRKRAMPTTYAMRWCRQDREEGNGPETGKQEKKRIIEGRAFHPQP